MHHAVGGLAARDERLDQRGVALLAALGAERVLGLALLVVGVAGVDADDAVPLRLELGAQAPPDAGRVHEDQPGVPLARVPRISERGLPERAPAPVLHRLDLGQVERVLFDADLARLEEVRLVVPRVGRQLDAAALLALPEAVPVEVRARRPGAPQRGEEVDVVVDLLVAVAHGREGVVRARAERRMLLRERAERAPRSALDQAPAGGLEEGRHVVGEAHRAPQMRHPVLGIGGLPIGDPGAGRVAEEGQLRGAQRDGAQVVAEGAEDGLELPRVRGGRDREPTGLDVLEALQVLRERVDGGRRAADHRHVGRVEHREVQVVGHQRLQLVGRQADRQHRALVGLLEELSAEHHEPEAVLVAHDAREVRGGVLAQAVPEQSLGLHAPALEQPRHRDAGDEDGRQLVDHPVQLVLDLLVLDPRLLALRAEEQGSQIDAVLRLQPIEPAVHVLAEHGLSLVEVRRHARELGAAARQEEDDRCLLGRDVAEDAARVGLVEQLRRLGVTRRREHPAALEGAAAVVQRPRHVGQALLGPRAQVRREAPAALVEAVLALRAQGDQLRRALARRGLRHAGRLLQDDVRVRAADAERVHRRAPGVRLGRGPVLEPVGHAEGRTGEVDRRVRLLEVEGRRELGVLEREHGLDEARRAGRGVEVADVGLDRADPAEARVLGVGAEGLGQRLDLDGVAEVRAGPVALDVLDGARVDVGEPVGLDHASRLAVDARREVVDLGGAVVVDGAAADDRVDHVAVVERVLEPAERHDARARAEDGSLRAVIERVAVPVRREDLALLVEVAAPLGQLDRHAAGEREVALPAQERLDGEVRGDERGGASGLDAERGAAQIEEVADPRGEEVLVVARVAQEEHAHVPDELGVGAEVEVEVAAHAAAAEDADGPLEALRRVPGVLERLPRHLEELPVLRIHDQRLLRREAEELTVEHLEAVEGRPRLHVVLLPQVLGALARREQLLIAEAADRFDPALEVGPQLLERVGARHAGRHAHDGDVRFEDLVLVRHVSFSGRVRAPRAIVRSRGTGAWWPVHKYATTRFVQCRRMFRTGIFGPYLGAECPPYIRSVRTRPR